MSKKAFEKNESCHADAPEPRGFYPYRGSGSSLGRVTLSRGPKQTCRMAIRELNVHRGWFTADSPHLGPPRGAASARLLLVLTPHLSPHTMRLPLPQHVPHRIPGLLSPLPSPLGCCPTSSKGGEHTGGTEREYESFSTREREMYESHTRPGASHR